MELIQENVSALAAKFGSTPEVITKFLTDASAAAEVKPFADTLQTLEVFKPDELTLRIGNERKAAADEAERNTKGSTYGAMDKRIEAETGVQKNAGESTIDYMARAAKEKFGKTGNESEEMQRLRDDLKAKTSLLEQTNTKLQEMEVGFATERKQTQINSALDGAIKTLPLNVPAEQLDGQHGYVKYMLMQRYDVDVVDGREQFTDKATKQIVRDPKTAEPMSAAGLVAQFAPTVVSLKEQSAKPGSGYKGSGNNFNQGEAAHDFSVYTDKESFLTELKRQGIAPGGKEGGVLYAKFKEARPDLFK